MSMNLLWFILINATYEAREINIDWMHMPMSHIALTCGVEFVISNYKCFYSV